jgi:hypothetical protein
VKTNELLEAAPMQLHPVSVSARERHASEQGWDLQDNEQTVWTIRRRRHPHENDSAGRCRVFGGSATIEPASDYVSRFRGDGRQSAMSLPFRSAYVSTFRGPSPRRARSGHPRPCGALPRLLIELSADRQ